MSRRDVYVNGEIGGIRIGDFDGDYSSANITVGDFDGDRNTPPVYIGRYPTNNENVEAIKKGLKLEASEKLLRLEALQVQCWIDSKRQESKLFLQKLKTKRTPH